jgi:A/G-specific adenine glycosylase
LHRTAKILAEAYGDEVPASESELRSLPGIGQYTSRAVLAFAFDIPTVFLETNIRSVYIRHFFDNVAQVKERQFEAIGDVLLDREHPRTWYTALMDYGAWLKVNEENYARKSLAFRPQTMFKGSERQLRGAILKCLVESSPQTLSALAAQVQSNETRVWICAEKLEKEGFVKTLIPRDVEVSSSELGENVISLAD